MFIIDMIIMPLPSDSRGWGGTLVCPTLLFVKRRTRVRQLGLSLSRSLHNSAAGGYSVNMVDWKYSSFFFR